MVVCAQVFRKVLCCIAFPRSMPDHDDFAARSQGIADPLVEARVLRSPLALLP